VIEDTKGVLRSSKSKNRQHNGQQWILTKLGTYLVLKRIWNPIDFQGHRVKLLGEGIRHALRCNDLQNTTQKRSSNTNPTKTGVNSGALERYRMWPKVLAHLKQNLYVINQNHIFERIQNGPPLSIVSFRFIIKYLLNVHSLLCLLTKFCRYILSNFVLSGKIF
jgi:hypothetical protein